MISVDIFQTCCCTYPALSDRPASALLACSSRTSISVLLSIPVREKFDKNTPSLCLVLNLHQFLSLSYLPDRQTNSFYAPKLQVSLIPAQLLRQFLNTLDSECLIMLSEWSGLLSQIRENGQASGDAQNSFFQQILISYDGQQ